MRGLVLGVPWPRAALFVEAPILKAPSSLGPDLDPDGKQGFPNLGPLRILGHPRQCPPHAQGLASKA